ncbi:NADH-quinone oxidoreductase subunit NuoH [Pedosphaera parvula]|uniref:NADH-quinone oxidoreductase subunit H n=1 Tax=Pedosphaera parvula (strain Ellin514) TaxID=320771 RepID=B9XHI2_PEDPL|nr:NADH-quinone oxidoreductase subunit NuoH [Pedosphaera parvula]EEF60817.1 NADH dehydrogenase (quinone) [Pedosphaera parvula Ellin514]
MDYLHTFSPMLAELGPTGQMALWSFVKIAILVGVVLTMVAYAVLVERKVSAFIQDRVGPNRAAPPFIAAIPVLGPFLVRLGIFQPLADGLKFLLKEDFTPAHVRKIYFWLAPMIAMVPALLTFAVIPFGSNLGGQRMVIADLNVGILYTFGIVSLGVYGIVLAGYAANSKYPFLGGIRSSAQLISYEIAMGMSVIPVFMLVGNLNLSGVIHYQTGGLFGISWLPNWLLFKQPLSFIIFIIAAFAETNRLPFDLPEAETELVAGYHTEYSSMKFALFFLGEYANMIASSAMMVTLFLGGWTLPWFGLDQPADSIGIGLLHIGIFIGKIILLMLIFIWIRWMFPRFRYDQLMDLGWRRFIPLALANILITAVVLWLVALKNTH